jgi:DNA-binding response OmpR family regulator
MAKRILIIEDDESVQDTLKLILGRAGYDIELSADGQVVYTDRNSWPDLFLLDRHVGKFDGLEICRVIKSKNETKNIPVIMISATPGVEPQAMEAGADFFVEKPLNTAILMGKVAEFCQNPA